MRKSKLTVKRGSKALEMIMRDVSDNLEDIFNAAQYQCESQTIQILSIELPEKAGYTEQVQVTNIYSISKTPPIHRSKDVVSYLLEREGRQTSPLSA